MSRSEYRPGEATLSELGGVLGVPSLSEKSDLLTLVAGTTARVLGEDGRYDRSGVDYAELGSDRKRIRHIENGGMVFDMPVTGTLNGASAMPEPARWARALASGSDAVFVGENRQVVLNLLDVAAPAVAAPPTYHPWSDGTNVFTDRADTGETVQVSQGGGNNTDPFLQNGVVIWTSDRADNGTFEPAALGGRYFSAPDVADEHPVIPLYWLACFGDSTTAGAGGWPYFLNRFDLDAALNWTIPVMNFGRSANTAKGIASRYWAIEVSYDCPEIPGDTTEVICTESSTNVGNIVETRGDDDPVTGHGYAVTSPTQDPMTGTLVK
ncbi:hypothetical protein, partial [Puniceibacterium confluentis]|uniref:hypothetical protein n=1 Tax=Puniceibacterium confluentis TaxID=1958944 RepID=UPI0035670005